MGGRTGKIEGWWAPVVFHLPSAAGLSKIGLQRVIRPSAYPGELPMSRPSARRFRNSLLAVVILVSASALMLRAQTLPPGVRTGPSMAGITEYTFPNGLRALILPDSGSSTVTVNINYLVGSRHEGAGEAGMAHLLEHLLFIRSTSDRDIKKELQDRGARWNGSTWNDRTNYWEAFNASTENLEWALGLEAERMVNMRIEQAILDSEMTVVRNEFERGENSVAQVLDQRVHATAFLWHNYGKDTIGSRADIERVPIARLADFYRKYYQPDNAIVVIAGQVDPPQALAVVARTLGAIPRPSRRLEDTYTVEPVQDGERSVELRRVGRGKNLVLAYHTPAMAHPDAASLEVLAGVLTGRGGTGRLDRALVDTKKALSVNMDVEEFHDPGLTVLSATLSDEQSIDDVKQVALDTITGLAVEPPTAEEVDRAKTRILQAMDRSFANSAQLAQQLTEVIAAGDWRLLFTNYEQLKQVTPADVSRVVKLYFKESNRTVGVFIPDAAPDRAIVPEAPGIDALLTTYKPDIHVEAGEALDPDPASLEKRIRRSTLPGGLKVVLLPKSTRGSRVQASLTLRFGDERSLAGRNAAEQMTTALLMRGTRTRSRQQLQDEMQRLNATIGIGGGGLSSVTANISTTAENLVPALGLAVEILRDPAFPASDFDQVRAQRIAQIDRGRTEPGTLVNQMLQGHLAPFPRGDVRHVRTIDEEIEDLRTVTLDDVKKFHQQFYGASQGELIAVGQFDPAALSTAAAELLGSWRSASPYARIVTGYQAIARINQAIETPDKENAQFSASLRLRMRDTDPDYIPMVMANYMFGGGGLSSRVPDRIRNREGLSYSVGTGFTAPVEGDAATLSMAAIANPANTPKVEASFLDELARTLRDGFTAAELAAAKKAFIDARIQNRSSDGGVLNLIAAREPWGRTLQWDADIDAKLQALTLDQVNAAFRRHVSAAGFSIIKGGDFKAARVYQ
jgi:zinc protease